MAKMRKILGKIYRFLCKVYNWPSNSSRILSCRTGAWRAGAHLVIGKRNRLGVPLRVNGRGSVKIGSGNRFGYGMAPMLGSGTILIQARTPQASITIGERNATSNNISIVSINSIAIGNDCRIGDLVAIYDSDSHEINPATRNRSAGKNAPVRIGNNVWLGSRVMVLKGVTIGDNSVIAAMSVVTKSVPPNTLAAGIPAKVIRSIE